MILVRPICVLGMMAALLLGKGDQLHGQHISLRLGGLVTSGAVSDGPGLISPYGELGLDIELFDRLEVGAGVGAFGFVAFSGFGEVVVGFEENRGLGLRFGGAQGIKWGSRFIGARFYLEPEGTSHLRLHGGFDVYLDDPITHDERTALMVGLGFRWP